MANNFGNASRILLRASPQAREQIDRFLDRRWIQLPFRFAAERQRVMKLMRTNRGLLRSPFLPGLELDQKALLALDAAKVLVKLHRAINSTAHAAFVRSLR